MKHDVVELIGLAIRHLDEVPCAFRRAALLDAAAKALDALEDAEASTRADQARVTASMIRNAEAVQLQLIERFSSEA